MEIVECPGCFSDLRIPPRSEIGGLGAALQDFVNIQDWDGAELALGRLRLVQVN